VGTDTPDLGPVDQPLQIDPAGVAALAAWLSLAAQLLDEVVVASPAAATPTVAQLWPEHFDVGLDLAFDLAGPAERRVNLGGSAGDTFHATPYLYVGPWTAERPGEPEYWNIPFGALIGYEELRAADDPVAAGRAFLAEGLARLRA